MPTKTFEKYSLDNELTGDEKQKLYNSGDRHSELYETFKARKKQLHLRPRDGFEQTKQQPQEINVTNTKPTFINRPHTKELFSFLLNQG